MKKNKKILTIRFSAMGDVAMAVPVVKAVVEQNENVEILFVSRPFFSAFFKNIPNVNFIGKDVKKQYKGLKGLYLLFKELKRENPDYIADLHDVIRSKVLRLFFKISGFKVGSINKGRREKKALTRRENKIFKPLKSTHERYADVFRNLDLKVDLTKVKPLPKPGLSTQIKLFLDTFGDNYLIGIAPFAAHEGKQYPLEKIEKVINNLLEKNKNLSIVLFGGGTKEKQLLNGLEKINRNRIVNVAGTFSLEEELQIISRLNKMLSMDSGNGHIATLYGIQVVSVWGATHPFAGFMPFSQLKINQVLPDLNKFPQLPTSIYGNKTFEGFQQVWESISVDEIVEKLLQN